jgi:protein gp37
MGEKTGISWCDHTFNPWIGCKKVSDGCKNCYAERDNKRYKWIDKWGSIPKITSETNWLKPKLWARSATHKETIFCGSLCDFLDDRIDQETRTKLFDLIDIVGKTSRIEWLLLTKRPENIKKFMPSEWLGCPPDYVRLGVTGENQSEFQRRTVIMSMFWNGKNFLSCEPLLSNIEIYYPLMFNIDWIIAGAESGPNHRVDNIDWYRNLRDQCEEHKIPFFLKQMWINGILEKEPELDEKQWLQKPEDK